MLTGESKRRSFRMRLMMFFAWLFFCGALIAFGAEALKSVSAGKWIFITPGELWYDIDVGSLNQLQAGVQRNLHPKLWDPVITTVLRGPVWASLLVLAFIFRLFAFRRRRQSGGMDRFRGHEIER